MKNESLISYYLSLLKGLRTEIYKLKGVIRPYSGLINKIIRLEKSLRSLAILTYKDWNQLNLQYKYLVHQKANALNDRAAISASYSSMEEFWRDADRQERGLSNKTFWDTYEHGRRRQLEKLIADSYDSKSALLLNSGMSAVAVTFGLMKLKKGDVVLINRKAYFETSKFIRDWIQPLGVILLKVDVENFEEMKKALKQKPKLIFVETITNEPNLSRPNQLERWSTLSPNSLIVIDNSIQSFNKKWFKVIKRNKNVLVIESGTKYLTQECMAGIIYGNKFWIERARDYARDTGQQLQEKAFNFISEGEVRNIEKKLRIHSRNVQIFFKGIKTLSQDFDIKIVGDKKPSPIVFIKFNEPFKNEARVLREIVETWKKDLKNKGVTIDIKAGFGWNRTSVRVYERAKLNQKDAPSYIRISVGIETKETIKILSEKFFESTILILNTKSPDLKIR